MSRGREIRRHAQMLAVGLDYLLLGQVPDPRRRCRIPLWQALTALLLGLTAGCSNLREVERLTKHLSFSGRQLLRLWRRLSDTTLRYVAMKLGEDPETLRELLYRQIRAAHRKKQLNPDGLPCGVIAVDGKYCTTNLPDKRYAQRQKDEAWRVGSLTAALISAPAAVCVDAKPIPFEKSESSAFPDFMEALQKAYGTINLFEVVTADAGIGSEANAHLLDRVYEKGYLFAVKENQPTLADELDRVLGRRMPEDACAETVDRVDNQTVLVRRLWRTTDVAGYHWDHIRIGLRVQAEKRRDDGTVLSVEDRYFVSNVPRGRFTPEQWLRVVRWHWRVELCHQSLDVAFDEDRRPWIRDAQGMVVVQLLRRVAYNILILYRNVSRRGENKAAMTWADMFAWLRLAVTAATEKHLTGLRRRSGVPPPTLPLGRIASPT